MREVHESSILVPLGYLAIATAPFITPLLLQGLFSFCPNLYTLASAHITPLLVPARLPQLCFPRCRVYLSWLPTIS